MDLSQKVNLPDGTVNGNTITINGRCEEVQFQLGSVNPSLDYFTIDYVDCDACESEHPCPTVTPTQL